MTRTAKTALSLVVILLCAALPGRSSAVREGRYDVSQLEASSAIILIGHVTAVKRGEDLLDTATIKVVSVLKGELAEQELTLDYRARAREERDLRTFRIKRGSSGVFFLKSVEGKKATLVVPGGMAFFPIPTYVGEQAPPKPRPANQQR